MSEWGNPYVKDDIQLYVKKIAYNGKTLGSEPSKYRQEKKSREYFLSSGERKGRSLNRVCVKHRSVAYSG